VEERERTREKERPLCMAGVALLQIFKRECNLQIKKITHTLSLSLSFLLPGRKKERECVCVSE